MRRKLRRLWLKLAWLFAGMALAGCMSPNIGEEPADPDASERVVVVDPGQPQALPSITVTASADAYSELAGWLGKSNTITIGEAMKVERPDVTLNIPAGASVSYEAGESLATFVFAKPLPTVSASVLGFHVSPTLSQIILKPDGSGVASTGLGRHGFRWLNADEDAGASGAASDLPEMVAYSTAGCPPCVVAKRELAAAKDLPFRVTWKDAAPAWVNTFPTFHWHVAGDDWRKREKWDGVEKLVEMWKLSREPKKASAANNSFQSARHATPDRVSTIGSRSVAIWSINGDSTPSRSVLLSHLINDGIHRGRHDRAMLETLTTEQLRWIHDRDHEGR